MFSHSLSTNHPTNNAHTIDDSLDQETVSCLPVKIKELESKLLYYITSA